mmetsp:Transcript_33919/g.33039  ORF Transcript_33919/g.33039 Transcript_33919/m.33039 type:complete len:83 (+) Transcript_33919:1179-1427(+)
MELNEKSQKKSKKDNDDLRKKIRELENENRSLKSKAASVQKAGSENKEPNNKGSSRNTDDQMAGYSARSQKKPQRKDRTSQV